MAIALLALCWGLGIAALVSLGVYYLWLKPSLKSARHEREEADFLRRKLEKEAELRLNEATLAAKEEAMRLRERVEAELNEKRVALARHEEKLSARDEAIERRRTQVEEREQALLVEQKHLTERADDLNRRATIIEQELQRVAKMKREDARELLLKRVEEDFREVGAKRAKQIEDEAIQEAERRAKKVVLDTIQRCVVDYVTEATLAVVELPGEDMKGRIIGREGRNIRAFEQVTGVDLIVDETPEAVVISCFDPVRREVARLTLMNLMVDGRIHPSRIEELHEKAQQEVERTIKEAGERACERAEVHGLSPRIVETMGRLRFRTSYAQNVLDHSVEVSRLTVMLANELGYNVEIAKRAGFLHDIGKALGPEWEGPHAITGMEFLRSMGEKEPVLHAVGAHHFEIEPLTPEAKLVIIADSISAARPGARRESLENYLKRLTALEGLANSFPGVERSYAVQAGREIRLIVRPNEVDDLGAARMASDVAKRIENELDYPGQIKVTVIRETRVQQVAK
ncbi:MAG TPA: ribonuclease Y [Fimbriimonadaceae bacterium]|nr:ribonuclease Y [Fimbriimonadaceae bacterium]